jgi:lysophospholipase L1-like esterase
LRPSRQETLGSLSPAYAPYSWAPEFWKEEQSRRKLQHGEYIPFRIWGLPEWHSQHINNDRTEFGIFRRTVNPSGFSSSCSGGARRRVWMFGGSTLYGSGVPDSATIPSFVSQELSSQHPGCFEVLNFGVEGYVSDQELLLLAEQLKAGRHPDIAVFYDGMNDSYVGAFAPGIPGAHWDFAAIKARMQGTILGKLEFLRNSYALRLLRAAVVSRSRSSGDLTAKSAAIVANYQANLRIARVLGDSYGFRVLSFWQPLLACGHKPLDTYEQLLVGLDANAPEGSAFPAIARVCLEAERRAEGDGAFIYLGDLFDSVREPLYIDRWMHLDPRGNKLVGRAIAAAIEKKSSASSDSVNFTAPRP